MAVQFPRLPVPSAILNKWSRHEVRRKYRRFLTTADNKSVQILYVDEKLKTPVIALKEGHSSVLLCNSHGVNENPDNSIVVMSPLVIDKLQELFNRLDWSIPNRLYEVSVVDLNYKIALCSASKFLCEGEQATLLLTLPNLREIRDSEYFKYPEYEILHNLGVSAKHGWQLFSDEKDVDSLARLYVKIIFYAELFFFRVVNPRMSKALFHAAFQEHLCWNFQELPIEEYDAYLDSLLVGG